MNPRGLLVKALSSALDYWQYGPAKLTDPVLGQAFSGGGRTYAGRSVTIDTALNLAPVYACTTLIAGTISTLPLHVYTGGRMGREIAREHPLYTLLHDSPNADETSVEFWERMVASLLLTGDAFAAVDRVLGRVVSLSHIPSGLVAVRRGDAGELLYTVRDEAGRAPRDLGEEEILHIRGFSMDGLRGLSVVAQAAQSLGIAMAADETAGRLFSNGMRTPGYLSAPGVINKERRAEAREYLAQFIGAANAGKIPLVEAGWEFKTMSLNSRDAELLASRQFSVEEICRWFRVPGHLIGYHEKSSSFGTGLEAMMLHFLQLTLRPWLKRIEAACKRRLIAPAERGKLEIEFAVEGLLRADSAGRSAFYVAMVQNGIWSRDEAREKENLPRRGGLADALTVQSQNVPLDLAGQTSALTPAPANPPATQRTAAEAEDNAA